MKTFRGDEDFKWDVNTKILFLKPVGKTLISRLTPVRIRRTFDLSPNHAHFNKNIAMEGSYTEKVSGIGKLVSLEMGSRGAYEKNGAFEV